MGDIRYNKYYDTFNKLRLNDMKERFFNVVLISSSGTYTRQLGTTNGDMFNAQELEQTVIEQLQQGGENVTHVAVSHWNEFDSKRDFEQFIKKTP